MRYCEILDECDNAIMEELMTLDEGVMDFIKNPILDFTKAIIGIKKKLERMKDITVLKSTAIKIFQEVKKSISDIQHDGIRNKGMKILNNNFLLSKDYRKTLAILLILKVGLETAYQMVSEIVPGMAGDLVPEAVKQSSYTFLEGILKWVGELSGFAFTFSAVSGASSVISAASTVKRVVVNLDKKLDDLMADISSEPQPI